MMSWDRFNPDPVHRDVFGVDASVGGGSGSDLLPSTPYGPGTAGSPGTWNMPSLPGAGTTIQNPGSWASNVNWGGVAGTAIPLVASLFAGQQPSIAPQIGQIQGMAQQTNQQGAQMLAQGQTALGPALDYYKSLLSGNPADVMAATAPDRRRVIDQYDTARRSAGQFTPRGGGQASAQQVSRSMEAGDLATLGAQARSQAAAATAQLGSGLETAGLSAEEHAQSQLAQLLQPLFQQQQTDSGNTLKTIAGIASLAAMFI